jgi:hypothetical protein
MLLVQINKCDEIAKMWWKQINFFFGWPKELVYFLNFYNKLKFFEDSSENLKFIKLRNDWLGSVMNNDIVKNDQVNDDFSLCRWWFLPMLLFITW